LLKSKAMKESLLDSALVESADHTSRFWRFERHGPVRLGSAAHAEMFARLLLDTFNPYKPAVIEWPVLAVTDRKRLVALPIWDIAVRTEGRARVNMLSYAARIPDPLVRKALEINGFEEGRHKEVLAKLVAAYGIALKPEPDYPPHKDIEWAYLVTGYSECIDSFFAFGLFELARRSGFFPPALVETFEPVIQEECRHILFFVNWAAWHRRNLPPWRRLMFNLRVAAVWAFLAWERIKTARDVGGAGNKGGGANFTATGHESMGLDAGIGDLLAVCLAENERRMAGYDERLVRPATMPRLIRLALPFLRRKPR
jgi:hypothetical protein